MTRYPMRLDTVWRPLLALLGGTQANSYVDVTEDSVRFRFGWGFDETVPRADIAGASRASWPMLGGIGWRLWLGGTIGLIGSLDGIVEVRLRSAKRMRAAFIPWRCRRIVVSLLDPDGFVAAI